jgi:O-antigen/teichoic acid export membrane protein
VSQALTTSLNAIQTGVRCTRSVIANNRGELLFTTGTLMAPLVSLVSGVIMVKWLKPQETGVLTMAALLPAYLSFLHFGVITGMSRNLPFHLGAGNPQKAERILWTSAATATCVGLIGFAVCCALALRSYFYNSDKLMSLALAATALTVLVGPIIEHTDIALRSYQRFSRLAAALIITNFASLLLTGLIVAIGAVGSVIRIFFVAVASMLCRTRTKLWKPVLHLDFRESVELSKTGIPLLVSGTLFSFFLVSDRSLVAVTLGPEAMGQFALAGMIVGSMQVIPQSLSMVLFPRIAKLYGETRSSQALRRYVWISLAFNVMAIVPAALLCYFLIEPLVTNYFPAYHDGVSAAKIACLSCLCWIYLGTGSVIGVTNRMKPYLAVMAFSLGVIWALGWCLVKLGYGIEGAAWARLAGTFILCVFTISYSFHLTGKEYSPLE